MALTHCNNGIFVDWLDVTLPLDMEPASAVTDFALDNCMLPDHPDSGSGLLFRCQYPGQVSQGTLRCGRIGSVYRVSFSGACLEYLRLFPGGFDRLLWWLGDRPHFITRIDVSQDVSESGALVLKSFRRKRKTGLSLGQRSQPLTWLLEDGPDGETGTMYVGDRRTSHISARVYDKTHQVLKRYNLQISPVTRYEVTVRGKRSKASPCLRDVHDPSSLFWHYASPALLKAPPGVSAWEPDSFLAFLPDRPAALDDLERLNRFLDYSGVGEKLRSYQGSLRDVDVLSAVGTAYRRSRVSGASAGGLTRR